MARLSKSFPSPPSIRAAIDLAFAPDLRVTLDSQNFIVDCEGASEAGERWIDANPNPVGSHYDAALTVMRNLTVESICL